MPFDGCTEIGYLYAGRAIQAGFVRMGMRLRIRVTFSVLCAFHKKRCVPRHAFDNMNCVAIDV